MTQTERAAELRRIVLEVSRLANRIDNVVNAINEEIGDRVDDVDVEELYDTVGDLELAGVRLNDAVVQLKPHAAAE